MHKRLGLLLVALGLVAFSCGGDDDGHAGSTSNSGGTGGSAGGLHGNARTGEAAGTKGEDGDSVGTGSGGAVDTGGETDAEGPNGAGGSGGVGQPADSGATGGVGSAAGTGGLGQAAGSGATGGGGGTGGVGQPAGSGATGGVGGTGGFAQDDGAPATFEIVNVGSGPLYLNDPEPTLIDQGRVLRMSKPCEYCLCSECLHCAICGMSNQPHYVVTVLPGASVSRTWDGIEWEITDAGCTCVEPHAFSGTLTVRVVYSDSYTEGTSPWGDETIPWQGLGDPKEKQLTYEHPPSKPVRIEIR